MNILREKKGIEIYAKRLEELITDLISGENEQDVFKSMKKILSKMIEHEVCTDIFIQKNTESTGLYGMSVYLSEYSLSEISRRITNPDIDTKEMTDAIINNCNRTYIIEIDSRILEPMYGFKPDEITSILLHELGHVLGDSDFYNEMKMAYEKAMFEFNDELENEKNNAVKTQLGMIYIMSVIQNTHMSKYTPQQKEELADKFVVSCGYGEPLNRAIDKFMKLNTSMLVKKDIFDISLEEAKVNIYLKNSMRLRKRYVTDLINIEKKKNKSSFVSKVLGNISKFFNKEQLHECVAGVDFYKYHILDESFLDLFSRNPIKTSQYDIDNLKIEMEMMEDYDDKSVLTYKIHKRIAQLNDAKKKLNPADSNYKYNMSCISSYINQLEQLLKEVMKFKVVEKKYGVFIKYPKGYEG